MINKDEIHELKQEAKRELAKRSMLKYMGYVWQKASSPFIVGLHTRVIISKIDKAIEDYNNGKSSYIIITVPPRHGKSDIVSRYLPPYFLGKLPDNEVILTSYTADLAEKMSKDSIRILKSDKYKELFASEVNPTACSASYYEIKDRLGKMSTAGLGGSITGKGADLLIIDDYLKNRQEAESETIRKKQWESFTNDVMTRLAPVHIVIILATRWHIDDIIGRIINKMDEDEDFPNFDILSFPAKSEKYETGYLFPERFSESWYRLQFSSLGKYGAAALLQCNPTIRGGNLLKVENVKIEDSFPNDLRYVRFWDLASTVKERIKDDPDYTVGTKMAVKKIKGIEHVFIADVRRIQAEAPRRDKLIETTAEIDGKRIYQGIESVAGYKDTYTRLKSILSGKSIVKECTVSNDKIIRASDLEPIFEAGNVHLLKGEWNMAWIDEFTNFPSGIHDDQVDSASGGYAMCKAGIGGSFRGDALNRSVYE